MKILDASPIILFTEYIGKHNCLSLLSYDGNTLLLPESVYKEVLEKDFNLNMDHLISKDVLFKLSDMTSNDEDKLKDRFPSLGNGEINVLAWGKKLQEQKKHIMCVLDDMGAKKAAKNLNLSVIGSIGLIKLLKDKKIINMNEISSIVNKIDESPFYIKNAILRSLLDE
jgi:predicted nucleic acid-binding protein